MSKNLFFIITIIILGTGAIYLNSFLNVQAPGTNFEQFVPNQQNYDPNQSDSIKESKPAYTKVTAGKEEISRANTNKKQVVFTFDGGSGTQSFEAILNTLEKHGVKGTFFLTGKWAEQNPNLTKQIADNGHEIFNHTYSHPYLTQITDEEIKKEFEKTEQIIFNLTGQNSTPYFRPPYGDRNQHVLNVAYEAGYQSVYWTIDALDWKEELGFTAEETKARILNNLSPGAIYLTHIGDNITGQILDEVFTEIKNQGYEIVSLTQAL